MQSPALFLALSLEMERALGVVAQLILLGHAHSNLSSTSRSMALQITQKLQARLAKDEVFMTVLRLCSSA
jgi:hypothetical protein